jgi:hypothetical protein
MMTRETSSTVVLLSVILTLAVFGLACGGGGGGGGGAIPPPPAVTYYVDDSNPAPPGDGTSGDPFLTIGEALAVPPASGDTVAVAGGTYNETIVMVDGVDLLGGYNNDFTVRDPVANVTTIDAGGAGSAVTGADNATLDGFTITGGNSGGVTLNGVNTTVTNNIVKDNATFGIDVYGGGTPTITDNEIYGNTLSGISVYAGPDDAIDATISNNAITDNNDAGIYVYAYNDSSTTLTIDNNEIRKNFLEGIRLINFPYYDYYSRVDAAISNNIIANNNSGGLFGFSYGYDTSGYGAPGGVTNWLLTNNIIEGNEAIGVETYAYGGYDRQSMLLTTTMYNNLIIGNEGIGIDSSAFGGSLDLEPIAPLTSTNDVLQGNGGYPGSGPRYGVYAYAYVPYDAGPPPSSPVTIRNDILGDHPDGDIYSYGYPAGFYVVDATYSNIADGSYADPSYANISANPLFLNAAVFFDWAIAVGTTTTVQVFDGTIYSVNDVIEINDDGVARTVTATAAGTVTFTPALPDVSTGGDSIKNFGSGGSVIDDYNLQTSPTPSPSIDAGDPDIVYNDRDDNDDNVPDVGEGNLRNDQGIYGGPFGGDPGPQ